ncbi:MAG: cystathionine beta-lyase [Friedmanniella sp.]|nr:cystathionine beta-lyase [Friedmanniella sp.]
MPADPRAANPFDCLSLAELRQRQSLKWRAYGPEVLPLWVAEMDTVPPPAVVAAVSAAMRDGDTGYPWGTGYAEALTAYAAEHWGWGTEVDAMRPVADVMTGIVEVLKVVTGPGDAVVVTPPVYPPFFLFVGRLDRRLVEAPLGPQGRLDLPSLEAAFVEATTGGRGAALVLASPHNPTGVVHTAAELGEVAALAERYGVRVVVDEIHAPLVEDGAFTPYLSVPGADRGFVVFSSSKGFNLAALKAALVVAGPGATEDLARIPPETAMGASMLGMLAHTAALVSGREWLVEHLAGIHAQRDLLAGLLADQLPAIGYRVPAATYLAWLDCRPLGLVDPAAFFLERAGVALNDGVPFGTGGAGHVRLNLATSTEVLTRAVQQMAQAYAAR